MEVDSKIKKEIGRGLLKLIEECNPFFGTDGQKTKLIFCESIGASFELRLRVRYEIRYRGKKYRAYEQTLVLSKDSQEVVARIDAHWVEQS